MCLIFCSLPGNEDLSPKKKSRTIEDGFSFFFFKVGLMIAWQKMVFFFFGTKTRVEDSE